MIGLSRCHDQVLIKAMYIAHLVGPGSEGAQPDQLPFLRCRGLILCMPMSINYTILKTK